MIKNSVPPEAAVLCRAFEGAVRAAQPAACMGGALAAVGSRGPALVLGAGKAAASSALAFCEHWGEPVRGMVVTRYGHGLAADEAAGAIEVIEAGHPSPDSASLRAGQQLLGLAASLRKDEQLFMLVSGGGSALAAAALAPLTFDQKRDAADFLIRSGADIREINCVRKHLSGLKGGRLARIAHPNPVITLAISDVPGDNVADIASGPTIADPTTQAEALAVLRKYAYPKLSVLERALRDSALETPGPEDPAFAGDSSFLIAKAATALDAAQEILADEGYEVIFLGDSSLPSTSAGEKHDIPLNTGAPSEEAPSPTQSG